VVGLRSVHQRHREVSSASRPRTRAHRATPLLGPWQQLVTPIERVMQGAMVRSTGACARASSVKHCATRRARVARRSSVHVTAAIFQRQRQAGHLHAMHTPDVWPRHSERWFCGRRCARHARHSPSPVFGQPICGVREHERFPSRCNGFVGHLTAAAGLVTKLHLAVACAATVASWAAGLRPGLGVPYEQHRGCPSARSRAAARVRHSVRVHKAPCARAIAPATCLRATSTP